MLESKVLEGKKDSGLKLAVMIPPDEDGEGFGELRELKRSWDAARDEYGESYREGCQEGIDVRIGRWFVLSGKLLV